MTVEKSLIECVTIQYKTTLMQNRLRNYYSYSKIIYYIHQQPSLVDKYDVMFVRVSR